MDVRESVTESGRLVDTAQYQWIHARGAAGQVIGVSFLLVRFLWAGKENEQ